MRSPTVLSIILLAAGLSLVLASGALQLGDASSTYAHAQPRPTLTPAPTVTPTAARAPTRTPSSHDDHKQPAAPGRITGTVIDLTTGAPAPGIAVVVGDVITTTDANGNYDRTGLAPGRYVVALALRADEGVPAQAPITLDLDAGATLVQHLAFRSAPPVATAAPPTAAPTLAAPPRLPVTGDASGMSWPLALLGLGLLLGGGAVRVRRNRYPA
jgi:Carboxypeptidase regulatory-like domain